MVSSRADDGGSAHAGSGARPDDRSAADAARLEGFRDYLRLQARIQLAGPLCAKIGASDVVQETLVNVYRQREQFGDWGDRTLRAYLRRTLTNTIANQVRHFHRSKRDVGRERPLEAALDRSSVLLDRWLAARGGSPSQIAQHDELVRRLLRALDGLDESERRAVVLQYWHGHTLGEIATELDRTVSSVVRLAHSALRKLREQLPSVE